MDMENKDDKDDLELEGATSQPEKVDTGLSSIMDEMSGSMSAPSEHAIEQAAEESREAEKLATVTDKRGDTFNPDQHATEADGTPKLTAAGNFSKRRGRKAGQTNSTVSVVGRSGQGKQETGQPDMNAQAAASGKMAAGLLFTVGTVIGGEEWQPVEDRATGLNEQNMMEKAFADYFIATGKTDIPPGWALVVAVGAYAAPRFAAPKTQKRAKNLFGKIKLWLAHRRLVKEGRQNEKGEKENSGQEKGGDSLQA